MAYLPVKLYKALWDLDFVSVPLPFSSTGFVWNQPQPGYLTRQTLAYLSALAQSWSWEQKCSLPCGAMKMMTSQRGCRKRGTENKEGMGSSEEQWTALNMKDMEHFYDHQGHFSKRDFLLQWPEAGERQKDNLTSHFFSGELSMGVCTGTVYCEFVFLKEGLLHAVITLMQCTLISELQRGLGSLDGYPRSQWWGR